MIYNELLNSSSSISDLKIYFVNCKNSNKPGNKSHRLVNKSHRTIEVGLMVKNFSSVKFDNFDLFFIPYNVFDYHHVISDWFSINLYLNL